ncbi:MAG: hypothetical protein ABIP38_10610 [Steroidobacteraceae bacterium]
MDCRSNGNHAHLLCVFEHLPHAICLDKGRLQLAAALARFLARQQLPGGAHLIDGHFEPSC